MTFLEKTADPKKLRAWEGAVEADYIYTAGIGGEKLLKAVKKDRTLVTAVCTSCERTFFPPRMYCEHCLSQIRRWGKAPGKATVAAVSLARIDEDGRELPEPQVWGLLRFEGIDGGLVHRLLVPPKQAVPGMTVRPQFKDAKKRTGEITDILGFVPTR